MTTASGGLRLATTETSPTALATALADASGADILANLSDEQKTSLAALVAPQAASDSKKKGKGKKAGNEGDNESDAGGNDGDDDDKMKAAKATAFAAGQKAANERFAAVAASEHFEGREKAAMKMLGTSMSADEITGLLADMPKGSDADAGMLGALRADRNPDLGASGDAAADAETARANNHGWEGIHAEVRARRSL